MAEEEHIIGILASLVRNLPLESGHRLRVVRKFVEDDYAKLERLLDLREGYEARVQAQDEKIARENEEQELDEDEIKEEEPLRALERLEAGLYCMQLIDLILAHLCAENLDLEVEEENKANGASSSSAEEPESEIKIRARTLLNRRGQSLDDIKENLKGEWLLMMPFTDRILHLARNLLSNNLECLVHCSVPEWPGGK